MSPTSTDNDTQGSRAGDDKSLASPRYVRGLAATYKEPYRLARAKSVQGLVSISEVRDKFGNQVASGAPLYPSQSPGSIDTSKDTQVLMSIQSDTIEGSEDEKTNFDKAFDDIEVDTHMLSINGMEYSPEVIG